jgi:hypothetical protein
MWRRNPGLMVLLAGLAVGVVGVVVVIFLAGPALKGGLVGPTYTTPFSRQVHLERGTYVVFERTGTERGGPGLKFTSNSGTSLLPDDVRVTDASGRSVPTDAISANETLNRNGAIYTGSVRFDSPERGDYVVTIDAAAGTTIVLAQDLGSVFAKALPGIALGGVGGIAVVVGAVMMIVRTRRGNPGVAATVPAGWYPDPYQPGAMRWWTGTEWAA